MPRHDRFPVLMPAREPSADMREAARACREWFDALVYEGFTKRQALQLVAQIIVQSQATKNDDGEPGFPT